MHSLILGKLFWYEKGFLDFQNPHLLWRILPEYLPFKKYENKVSVCPLREIYFSGNVVN